MHDALKKVGHDFPRGTSFERMRDAHHDFLLAEEIAPGQRRERRDAGHPPAARRCSNRGEDLALGSADRQFRGSRAHQARTLRPLGCTSPLRCVRRRRRRPGTPSSPSPSTAPAPAGLGDPSRYGPTPVVVIGDTPSDVACANAGWCRAGRGRDRHLQPRGTSAAPGRPALRAPRISSDTDGVRQDDRDLAVSSPDPGYQQLAVSQRSTLTVHGEVGQRAQSARRDPSAGSGSPPSPVERRGAERGTGPTPLDGARGVLSEVEGRERRAGVRGRSPDQRGSERGPVAFPVFKIGRCPRFAGGLGSTPTSLRQPSPSARFARGFGWQAASRVRHRRLSAVARSAEVDVSLFPKAREIGGELRQLGQHVADIFAPRPPESGDRSVVAARAHDDFGRRRVSAHAGRVPRPAQMYDEVTKQDRRNQ